MAGPYLTAVVRLGKDLTMWYAVDYGCAVVSSLANYGKQGRSEQRLVSLSRGEPDASYFRVPATYKELPPSGLLSACGPSMGKALVDYDRKYAQRRPTVAMMATLETGPGPIISSENLREEAFPRSGQQAGK
jgi:hypothetical protein